MLGVMANGACVVDADGVFQPKIDLRITKEDLCLDFTVAVLLQINFFLMILPGWLLVLTLA
jgi:hypothetical protein